MRGDVDWDQERRRAAQQSQGSLMDVARRAGWVLQAGRGKGSHVLVSSTATRRPVTIPGTVYRVNALQILRQLEEGSPS